MTYVLIPKPTDEGSLLTEDGLPLLLEEDDTQEIQSEGESQYTTITRPSA